MGSQGQIPANAQAQSRGGRRQGDPPERIRRPLLQPHAHPVPLQQVYHVGQYPTTTFTTIAFITSLSEQKLIKRSVFPDHTRILSERQDILLSELSQLARDGFLRAQEEHQRSVALWGSSIAFPEL